MNRITLRRAAIGLLLLFLLIAIAVEARLTRGADEAMLEAFRRIGPTHPLAGPRWELPLLLDWTSLGAGIVRVPVTIGGGLLLALIGRRREGVALVAAVASGAAALPIVKALVHRARPNLAWHLAVESDWSFPSGHSMGSMILYPLLGAFLLGVVGRARPGLAAGVLVALAVGLTRIMLGVHWASDVAAGWCLGGAWCAATLALMGRRRPA